MLVGQIVISILMALIAAAAAVALQLGLAAALLAYTVTGPLTLGLIAVRIDCRGRYNT